MKKLTIGWLYPELMSTYGDRGNIICLKRRCEWRGIDVEIRNLDVGFSEKELIGCDLLFMGGAQDRQQKIVGEDLAKKRNALKEMIEDYTPGVYICGAYQFLGRYYKEADGSIVEGLGILDLYTEHPGFDKPRLIGNIVVTTNVILSEAKDLSRMRVSNELRDSSASGLRMTRGETLVGFENHGGRTYLGKEVKPLGKVLRGFGNNGKDGTEGVVYKNSFGSYFHGPILPKNPKLADLLIKLALEKKYLPANATHKALQAGKKTTLKELDDSLENKAHEAILKRLNI